MRGRERVGGWCSSSSELHASRKTPSLPPSPARQKRTKPLKGLGNVAILISTLVHLTPNGMWLPLVVDFVFVCVV